MTRVPAHAQTQWLRSRNDNLPWGLQLGAMIQVTMNTLTTQENNNLLDASYNGIDFLFAFADEVDLLQEKPSHTATIAEIQSSGLEIITQQQLEQYQQDGKVTSNCAEQCVICLVEYQPEEELRVMSCRHAFHRGCIDYWLEAQQNNCPICRSTGVPTNTSVPSFSDEAFDSETYDDFVPFF